MRISQLFQHLRDLRAVRLVFTVGVMTISAAAFNVAGAQSLFTIPDTTPNYDNYRYIDDCMSAVDRITSEIELRHRVWRDTLPYDAMYSNRPRPQNAIDMGKQCMAHVDVDTLSLDHPEVWATGLLMANRDEDAQRLYARYFDSLPKDKWSEAFIEMFKVFEQARPRRYTILQALYKRGIDEIPADSVHWGIFLRTMMASDAVMEADTAFAQTLVDQGVSLARESSESMKLTNIYKLAGFALYKAIQRVYPSRELDSLKVSTAAFRRYRAGLMMQIFGDTTFLAMDPSGIKAPQLVGDYWFRSDDTTGGYHAISSEVRPVPHRVNLIAFLQGGCHETTPNVPKVGRINGNAGCWRTITMLRRLKERYPDLELTIVSKTYGSLGNAPPLEPEAEADTLAKYFLGFHHLPATQIVVKTPYFRVDGLDQRRVDEVTKNETNYTFQGRSWAGHLTILAIDKTGYIFFGGGLNNDEVEILEKEIEAVYSRPK